jgi:hypothetical protein
MHLAKAETLILALASGGLPPPRLRSLEESDVEDAAAHAGVNLQTA